MKSRKIGKYEVVERIGKGSMGEVFRARDTVLKRDVAIKTMSAHSAADDHLVQRFHREARSAARLNHPNIITVYDFGEEDGQLYLAMELLAGIDLKDLIGKPKLGGLADRVAIMEQIAEGLAYAHAQGLVHRDIKPANIHLLSSGRVKILDFGLARLGESEMTKQGMVMGTPHYMSPEQVHGQRADARSDVFSLGAVCYEMLTSRRPFRDETMAGILQKVVRSEPEPIGTLVPDCPEGLVQVVARALRKDPTRRYQNAQEFLDALRAARQAVSPGAPAPEGGGDSTPFDDTVADLHAPTLTDSSVSTSGATALAPRSDPGRAPGSSPPTVPGASATQAGTGERASRARLMMGLGLVVLGAGAGVVFLTRQLSPTPPATLTPGDVAREQVGILTETLVANQVELARVDLENKDYEAALAQAERALTISPDNAEARAVVDQARQRLFDLDEAATEARSAFARGDTQAASEALGKVMALDPRHPVAGELSSKLNAHFRAQAERAQAAMRAASEAAERTEASGPEGYDAARRLAREADVLFGRQEYAVATQRYLEARDQLERARRASEAAARPSPVAPVATPPPATRPPVTAAPPPTAPAPRATLPPPTVPPTTAPPATAPSQEPALRQLIDAYKRALETQDLALFRTVKPNLSTSDEKRLAASFKAIKSQIVGISVESVEIEGDRATVRVVRQDTINGRQTRQVGQTFRLSRGPDGWVIEDIGQ